MGSPPSCRRDPRRCCAWNRRLRDRERRDDAASKRAHLRPSRPRRSAAVRLLRGWVLRAHGRHHRPDLDRPLHHRGHHRLRPGRHDRTRRLRSGGARCHLPARGPQVRGVGHQLPGGRAGTHPVGTPQRRRSRYGRVSDIRARHSTARVRRTSRSAIRSRSMAAISIAAEPWPRRANISTPEDGDYFPCMVAAQMPVAPGDSGGAVLVRGIPAGVTSRSFGRLARLHAPRRGSRAARPRAVHHA